MNIASNKYKKRLKSLKKGVIKQFGKGTANNWRNRDFEDLSFEIRKATKVLISAATLKRIFGKNKTSESYYPQESTLKALEQYGGSALQSTQFSSKSIVFFSIIIVLFIGGAAILFTGLNKQPQVYTKASLELKKIEGTNPSTVFFNFDDLPANDSVFIHYDDENNPQYLSPHIKAVSHVYNLPGLFDVFLQTRRQVLSDSVKVLVPTNGWQAMASYFDRDFDKRYYPIPLNIATTDKGFHPDRKTLASVGIDTTKILVLSLDNFVQTDIDGDNFRVKTKIKNVNYWPAIRCYSAHLTVFGNTGSIHFKFPHNGCSGYGAYTIGEKSKFGTTSDLSFLAVDIKNWNTIEIENSNKQVKLKLNKQLVMNESYLKTIGNVVGISLQFHGSGFVEYIELSDGTSPTHFSTYF